MKRIPAIVKKITNELTVAIPHDLSDSFEKDLLEDNYARLSVVSVTLFAVECVLLFLQEKFFGTGFITFSFLLISSALIPLIIYIRLHMETVRRAFALAVIYAYAVVTLLLGASLSLFAMQVVDITHVYLMAVLGVALFIYVKPLPLAIIFAAIYTAFSLLLPQFAASPNVVLTLRVNTFVFNLFSWLLALLALRSRAAVFISRRKLCEQNRALEDLTQRDAMTGLYHHAASLTRLEEEIARAQADGSSLCLIMTDIDDFKSINDTYGHQFGDDVISRAAAVFKNAVMGKGIVGRYGGEEFLIILPGYSVNDALALAENIQKTLSCTISQPRVTVSGGISLYNGETLNAFVRQTDEKLYHAKNSGKQRFIITSPAVNGNIFQSRPM